MNIENVREYLREKGFIDRLHEFEQSTATVDLAAEALGTAPDQIAKTLSFYDKDGGAILVVAAGKRRVDNRKFKDQFGLKAKMLSPEDTLALIGHAVGGVCPFAVNDGVRVYLDASLRRFATVFPACGSSNSAIELTLPELERFSACAGWVDVCKNWAEA